MWFSEPAGRGAASGGLVQAVSPERDRELAMAACHGDIIQLARAQLRRECRRYDFNWAAFVDDRREGPVAEVVHRRAMARVPGAIAAGVSLTDVMDCVRQVMSEWEAAPELRPNGDDFRREQVRRGDLGRQTQQVTCRSREAAVAALLAEGITGNSEIARRLGISRTTVWRIRSRLESRPDEDSVDATPSPEEFPLPEAPARECWPAERFMAHSGRRLDADAAQTLVEMGHTAELEGRENDLARMIRQSCGAGIRDPWAYLMRAWSNRSDAWSVTARLLADVLAWSGAEAYEGALMAMAGGYVDRPVAYLNRMLVAAAQDKRQLDAVHHPNPVAMAVSLARQHCPDLLVVDAAEAVAAERAESRRGYLASYRRRYGKLPWEDSAGDAASGVARFAVGRGAIGRVFESYRSSFGSAPWERDDATQSDGGFADGGFAPGVAATQLVDSRCSGLKGAPGDGFNYPITDNLAKLPSPGARKAGATLPARGAALEPAGVSRWSARRAAPGSAPLPGGRCRHELASRLVTAMDLDSVQLVDCSAGCGHRLYSDRGPLECPCHWSPARFSLVRRALAAS